MLYSLIQRFLQYFCYGSLAGHPMNHNRLGFGELVVLWGWCVGHGGCFGWWGCFASRFYCLMFSSLCFCNRRGCCWSLALIFTVEVFVLSLLADPSLISTSPCMTGRDNLAHVLSMYSVPCLLSLLHLHPCLHLLFHLLLHNFVTGCLYFCAHFYVLCSSFLIQLLPTAFPVTCFDRIPHKWIRQP